MADNETLTEWTQVGTVEILQLRVYPLDPAAERQPLATWVAVEAGIYPLFRKCDAFQWRMSGHINERVAKIGDGLFSLNGGDVPTGLEVTFPSPAYGLEQFREFMTDPMCQPGPQQRLRFLLHSEVLV